jgi:hypothetical protein
MHDLIRGLKRFDILEPMAQELTNHYLIFKMKEDSLNKILTYLVVPKSAQVIRVRGCQFGHQGRFCKNTCFCLDLLPKTSENGLVKADDSGS